MTNRQRIPTFRREALDSVMSAVITVEIRRSATNLDESSVSKGQSDHDRRRSNIEGLEVDEGKDEGGEGESAETERGFKTDSELAIAQGASTEA